MRERREIGIRVKRRGGWVALSLAALLISQAALAGCSQSGGGQSDLQGSITISGSTALLPLVQHAAQLFDQRYIHAHVDVSGGGSLHGIQAVTSHQVTIGDSDVYADPGTYPDPTLTDHLVAVIPFTMIVNPDVANVASLKHDQIIGVFSSGQYSNWQQLGGPDLPIMPVVRPPTSGTRLTFRKYVMGGRDEKGIFLKTDSSQTVLTTVATTPGAIGYVALSVLDKTVKPVSIDGVSATPTDIEAGRYPFWGYEHMYTLGDGNALTSAFLDYMLTPEIQGLAKNLGYIPISQMQVGDISQPRASSAPYADVSPRAWKREEATHV
ncbi:MAG TPA: phosphate ABC transporter substrate-binding protein [Ktedonobacterales bacterium]